MRKPQSFTAPLVLKKITNLLAGMKSGGRDPTPGQFMGEPPQLIEMDKNDENEEEIHQ